MVYTANQINPDGTIIHNVIIPMTLLQAIKCVDERNSYFWVVSPRKNNYNCTKAKLYVTKYNNIDDLFNVYINRYWLDSADIAKLHRYYEYYIKDWDEYFEDFIF